MKEILANPYFKYFCVPLITTFLCTFVKMVSRNDQFGNFRKEDLAVGLEISITSLIIFITDSVNVANAILKEKVVNQLILEEKYISIPWVLLAFIIGIWAVSTIVRKLGWENETDLRLFWGIILPDCFGIFTLIFVVVWIGR